MNDKNKEGGEKRFKDEVKTFLLNTSVVHLRSIDEWAEINFPGESLDAQPDTQIRVEQGDFLSAVRLLRKWLQVKESELETDYEILLRLRMIHHTWSLLFGASMAIGAQKKAVRLNSKKAASVRHKGNNEIAAEIRCWYLDNREKFSSMDDAADKAVMHFDVKFRTARKHIGTAKKEMLESKRM